MPRHEKCVKSLKKNIFIFLRCHLHIQYYSTEYVSDVHKHNKSESSVKNPKQGNSRGNGNI